MSSQSGMRRGAWGFGCAALSTEGLYETALWPFKAGARLWLASSSVSSARIDGLWGLVGEETVEGQEKGQTLRCCPVKGGASICSIGCSSH